ncbi:hypothetical protein DL93DRAFT_1573389 [Clavulina sp. PMI_390]|nr:hypothetical protein DL93DRAFT_1573389 [Clavulina sp. PMI_390]
MERPLVVKADCHPLTAASHSLDPPPFHSFRQTPSSTVPALSLSSGARTATPTRESSSVSTATGFDWYVITIALRGFSLSSCYCSTLPTTADDKRVSLERYSLPALGPSCETSEDQYMLNPRGHSSRESLSLFTSLVFYDKIHYQKYVSLLLSRRVDILAPSDTSAPD